MEQAVLNSFRDPSQHVVREACKTSAALGLGSAHDAVFRLLDSPSEWTRLVAVGALSDLWRAADSDKLLALFEGDPADDVRKEAAWVLRAHAALSNCRDLFRCWQSDAIPRHRTWACELASEFAISDVEQELEELANDPDGYVRRAARVAPDRVHGTTDPAQRRDESRA